MNIISRCPELISLTVLFWFKKVFLSVSRERDSHLLVHGASGPEAFLPGCGAGHGHLCFYLYRYLAIRGWTKPRVYLKPWIISKSERNLKFILLTDFFTKIFLVLKSIEGSGFMMVLKLYYLEDFGIYLSITNFFIFYHFPFFPCCRFSNWLWVVRWQHPIDILAAHSDKPVFFLW